MLAVVLIVVVTVFRQPLSERLLPQTQAQTLHEQAQTALARGHLSAADGTGARQLYEAALALDPDRRQAREGLTRVAQAALQQAREATAQQRYDDAHRALQLAQDLSVPRADYEAAAEALRMRESAAADIGHLLMQARAARLDGRLDGGADSALALYARVLSLQPGNAIALEGRDDTIAYLLQLAGDALRRGDLTVAADRIHRARDVDPGHVELPELQAQLLDALGQRRHQADHDLRNARLNAALAGYREVLLADPGDAQAQRGIEQVAIAWAQRGERLAADFRFAPADAALDQARAIAPELAAVREVEIRVQRLRATQTTLAPVLAPAEREQRVRTLLAQAEAARNRGDLLTPPGESAFDKLRAARTIAPQHPAMQRATQQLRDAAVQCFEQSLQSNHLTDATACLDARGQLGASPAALQKGRRELALRWIAYGDERLGAGELSNARRALAAARTLDSTTPGLIAFAERLRAAMIAVD